MPLFAKLVTARLEGLEEGFLEVGEAKLERHFGQPGSELSARIDVHDARFWAAVALRGSIGAGEAYAEGWWTSPAPTEVVRLFARNQRVLSGVDSGLSRLSRPFLAAYHAVRRNTQRGSRENIGAHYDLSNDFFRLFLDSTLTYSCGVFEEPDRDLRSASIRKMDLLCRKLDLSRDDHLLEIGTGWGAFAIHAASHYGCRVTTTTISREQRELAAQRIREAGVEDRVTLLGKDYRQLDGSYDKLVSVEMIEAVGHHYFGDFFEACSRLLRPDGRMALQAITITDQEYDRARDSVDFIKRHIFPGACIPSVTALCQAATGSSDLRLTHLEDIGLHYATTLAHWRSNLRERWRDALALGFDERFLRLWEFYFCYCEGGFAERYLGNAQMVFMKPRDPGPVATSR